MDLYGISSVSSDCFAIDDLLDVPNDEQFFSTSSYASSTISSAADLRRTHSPLPSIPFAGHSPTLFTPDFAFTDGLYVPNDEVEELEWLSQVVDDSFSDFNFMEGTGEKSLQPENSSSSGETRQKGSGAFSVQAISPEPEPMSTVKLKSRTGTVTKNFSFASTCSSMIKNSPGGRKCSHCSSEKTPQWRTGPLGPKSLCNACGVRFKSGRLVPEYRPAASPTFVLTQHSNSHRKVLELRRQKELSRQQPPQQMEEKFYAQAHDFQVC